MNLTKQQIEWIKANRETLDSIFGQKVKDLKDSIFLMPQGEQRDIQIETAKEIEDWMKIIQIISNSKEQKSPEQGL